MSFDRILFSSKLKRYCDQLLISKLELSNLTGISEERLTNFLNCSSNPTGDEVLILADIFMCDYKFLISNEKEAAFEQTDYLFRKYGDSFTKEDRRVIQEVLYFAECEEFLINELELKRDTMKFSAVLDGNFYKAHGEKTAKKLREFLGYSNTEIPIDVYKEFREIGIHIFRRKFGNSKISGVCLNHPKAGKCVVVNFDEDVYRQRFTVAHEVGHALFDLNEENKAVVSFNNWSKNDLIEIRANTFASHFLMPREFLAKLSQSDTWNKNKILYWADKLKVNVQSLIFSLKDIKFIGKIQEQHLLELKLNGNDKSDPEIGDNLSEAGKLRKRILLERGLSNFYVKLCFSAYRNDIISLSRMCEMLLLSEDELLIILDLYNERT